MLIIHREYRAQVTQRSFWLMTLLLPMLFGCGYYLLMTATSGNDARQVYVIDREGSYADAFTGKAGITYLSERENSLPDDVTPQTVLYIGTKDEKGVPSTIFYSTEVNREETKQYLTCLLSDYILHQKLQELPDEMRSRLDVPLDIIDLSPIGNSTEIAEHEYFDRLVIFSTLIYLFIFIFSARVLQSTVQEKSNRILEILLTSVKARDLIYGKIIAIALCGVTQFLIWGALFLLFMRIDCSTASGDFAFITPGWTILFFLSFMGGYLLYASLFAIVGAYINPETDSRQFVVPLTFLSLIAFYVGLYSLNDMSGNLAAWCTYLPFTSPMLLVTRYAYDMPVVETLCSLALLFFFAGICIHFASRIYQSRLLSYKKR